ncbi:hypothetical protein AB4Z22_37550, partial [Paenibacillus sp. TAF58]
MVNLQRKLTARQLTVRSLQNVARKMLPLFRKAAFSRTYAIRLARAIREEEGNIDRIIQETVPSATPESIEVEDVGFFICFGPIGNQL